jgi:homocysteine S-methyltransferase
LARNVAGEHAYVAGALGPLGVRLAPWGKLSVEEAEGCFSEQAEALLEGGVDLFVLETFRDVTELQAAIRSLRRLSSLPVVAQMSTGEDGNGPDGSPPEAFARALDSEGADVVGVNCGMGPAPMLETIERMASATSRPLSAQPNAGGPRELEGRHMYLSSPDYLASYARRFVAHGVRLVGGCCGTTPDHIRQIKKVVGSAT